MSSPLRQNIASGIGWNFVNQFLTQIAQITALVVLARLLTPRDYGVVGLVLTFTGFAAIFVELGLIPAVIRKQNLTQTEMATAFWTNNFLGWIMFALLWFLAHPIASFYREPAVLWITRISALNFLISPLFALHNALVVKELKFKFVAKLTSATLTLSTTLAILLAWQGYGYWSLIVPQLITSVLSLIVLWVLVPWRPTFEFSGAALKEFFGFSGYLSGTQIIGYWTRNLDKMMLGRMLGAVELGLYSRAYNLMLLPLQQVSRVVDAVLFPAFSSIQNDPREIGQIYLKITRLVALLTFPVCFGLWIVAEPAVLVVFGEKWREVIPIIQILCPLGAVQSILSLNGSIYLSQGRTSRAFVVTFAFTPALAIAFYLGLTMGGMTGMLWGYVSVSVLSAPFIYLAGASLVGLRITDMVKNLAGVFGCTMTMTASVFLLRFVVRDLEVFVQLVVLVSCGVVVYLVCLRGFGVQAFAEALQLIQRKLVRNKPTVAVPASSNTPVSL